MLDFVQELNHGVVLSDTLAIEVLPDSICELVLALPSLVLVSGHRRREASDTWAGQNQLVVLAAVCGWCLEAICVSI